MERSKIYLKQEFRDGERPTGADFGDLIDSFMSKVDDAVSIDANQNLDIPGGVNLGDVANGQAGTLRFNGGQVQFFDGSVWKNIGGTGGGAFTPVAGGPSVAFAGGNVGVGAFATPPINKFEVNLAAGGSPGEAVKFGNAVISNGPGGSQTSAQFANQAVTINGSNPTVDVNANFALRQTDVGQVILNAPTTQSISIAHGRTQARIYIPSVPPGNPGKVVIANGAALISNIDNMALQVNGQAGKNDGQSLWTLISDRRLKKDIKPFEDGLDLLMKVQPVKFKYNGKLGTNPETEQVGVIGQDIGKIFPYMISSVGKSETEKDGKDEDALMFNGHALTYVMINAIQELAQRVKDLETALNKKGKNN